MSEPHHVTPARRPLPHSQSVHIPTTNHPLCPCFPYTWALDLDLALHSNLRRVGLDRCHRRRPRKGFTMRRKFSLAWSLFSFAAAVPASRLTTKPARPSMPCSNKSLYLKRAPSSSGVNSTGLQFGGGDMPRRALAPLAARPQMNLLLAHTICRLRDRIAGPLWMSRSTMCLVKKSSGFFQTPAHTVSTRSQVATISREVGPF